MSKLPKRLRITVEEAGEFDGEFESGGTEIPIAIAMHLDSIGYNARHIHDAKDGK